MIKSSYDNLFTELVNFSTPMSKIVEENLFENITSNLNNNTFLTDLEKENEYIRKLYHCRYNYYKYLDADKLLQPYLEKIYNFCDSLNDWNKVFDYIFIRDFENCILKVVCYKNILENIFENIEKKRKIELIQFCETYDISLFQYGTIDLFLELRLKISLKQAFYLIEKKIYNSLTIQELEQIVNERRTKELNTKIMLNLHFDSLTSPEWFNQYLKLWEYYCLLDQTPDLIEKIKCWTDRLDYLRIGKYQKDDFFSIFHQWLVPFPKLAYQPSQYYLFYDDEKYYIIYDKKYKKVEKYVYEKLEILEKKYYLYCKLRDIEAIDVMENIISYGFM